MCFFIFFRSACFLAENRYAKWHHLKHSLSLLFFILIHAFVFPNLACRVRYEKPLSGVYLLTDSSCLSTNLTIHLLPFDIQSLIFLRSSLLLLLITLATSFSLVIYLAFVLKWPSCSVPSCFIRGSCKKFCHWIRISSVLRFKNIFLLQTFKVFPLY